MSGATCLTYVIVPGGQRLYRIFITRAKLGIYAHTGLLSTGDGPHIFKLEGKGK